MCIRDREHGVAHWSRANGWIFMATADLLARMPENHPMREDVIKNFQMQASGVARYQGKNGLWHQLLDKEDSYEEITGSSMFVFGIAKGVKEGWLHPDFIYVAWQGFKGMLSKISENGDVTAICVGTGIMPGSYTHLDVYKRQIQFIATFYWAFHFGKTIHIFVVAWYIFDVGTCTTN